MKAGQGHSWKGSVISHTVKRDYPTVPMMSLQHHNEPRSSGDFNATKTITVSLALVLLCCVRILMHFFVCHEGKIAR